MPFKPPVEVSKKLFGERDYEDLEDFIKERVKHLEMRLEPFRESKLPEYVRLYKGVPKNKDVEWPWPGASNLQIQLVGTFSDELLSRVMGNIFSYDPLVTVVLGGDSPEQDGEAQKQLLEKFLMDMAYDSKELDIYRVEQAAFHSAIKYGTGIVYSPYEFQQEVQMTYISGGETPTDKSLGSPSKITVKDGPHPELLPLNRFGFDPEVPSLSNMKFYYSIEKLDYWEVKNLKGKSPYYKQVDIDKMLSNPDARQESEMDREINETFAFGTGDLEKGQARWYIYNCFFKYERNGETYSMMAKYHKKSEKILFIVYNNYPNNIFPVEDVKMAYDDESYLGIGFAEMLHAYQKELSNNWNWRANNRNYAMLGAWRVSPESKLSSIFDVFPGVGIPAKEGELEFIKQGNDIGYSNEADQFTMACAKERAGVDPATGGTGGGIVNQKRGIYSAAGTSMVMSLANNRNNLRTSDMRTCHVRLFDLFATMYANFGIGNRLRRYGTSSPTLEKALQNYKDGNLGLKLRPSSASLNKELERQNDILLSDRLDRYYASQAQVIQAMGTPNMPPELQQFYSQQLVASRILMMALLRNFNKDNPDALLPQVKSIQAGQPPQAQGGGLLNGAGNQNRGFAPSQGVPTSPMGAGGVPTSPQLPI